MKYKNAKNIFPDDILEELQKYVQGEYVYIPIKDKAVNANITEYGMEVQCIFRSNGKLIPLETG